MIKNYIYTVGRYLPASSKKEVLAEIESNIYDYLVENFGQKEYSESEIEEAVRFLGHPKKVAESYLDSPRSLIGSSYIDIYFIILKIAILATSIGIFVSTTLVFDGNFLTWILSIFSKLWANLLTVIGFITFIFAIIEYYKPSSLNEDYENWSLNILEEEPTENTSISPIELIVESFILLILITIFVQPDLILSIIGNNISFIALIPNFDILGIYFILIIGIFILNIILNFYLIYKGKWSTISRFFSVFLNILFIILAGIVVFSPNGWLPLSNIPSESGETIDVLTDLGITGLRIGYGILILIISLDIWKHLNILLNNKKAKN